jgi:hypothetical protein
MKKLSFYITSPPPEESLHIIVEAPPSRSSRPAKRSHEECEEGDQLGRLPKRVSRNTTPPNHPTKGDANSPLQHTPPKSRDDFDRTISEFLTKCRPRMRELVENADTVQSFFRSWSPGPSVDEKLAKHISGLCIPRIGGLPSLLLHDLGEERDDLDRDRSARIPDIFSVEYHTCVIRDSVKFLRPITLSF